MDSKQTIYELPARLIKPRPRMTSEEYLQENIAFKQFLTQIPEDAKRSIINFDPIPGCPCRYCNNVSS